MPNLKNRALMGAMATAMLAASVAGPASAFAATAKSTDVTLKADDSNLTLTVPTQMPFVMAADGTLTTPGMEIVNGSNFAVHVSDVAVAGQGGYALVADAAQATEDNAVDFQFGVDGALVDASTAGASQLTKGKYDMGPAGAADTLSIKAEGNAKNIKEDISAEQAVAQITWTFSAGAAK